jgi:hypothetical protein
MAFPLPWHQDSDTYKHEGTSMTIERFSSSTSSLDKKDVVDKLKEMNEVAEEHDHEVIAMKGDKQHPEDIKWQVKNDKKKVVHDGSIPMTAHSRGDGNKNLKAAIGVINKAIDYLNDL